MDATKNELKMLHLLNENYFSGIQVFAIIIICLLFFLQDLRFLITFHINLKKIKETWHRHN